MRRFILAFLLLLMSPCVAYAQYYVCASSCVNGATPSDASSSCSAGTFAAPFLTITHARDVMRSCGTKKTIIEAGTYTLSADLTFTSSDNGTTYVSYPGATATISGGGSPGSGNFGIIVASGTTGMVFKGLTFKNFGQGVNLNGGFELNGDATTITNTVIQYNTFQDCTAGCLTSYRMSGILVDSNKFLRSISTTVDTGSGYYASSGNNITASRNYCENMGYGCVVTAAIQPTNDLTQHDIVFDRNVVVNACQKYFYVSGSEGPLTDCGAIYMGQRQDTSANPIYNLNNKITNNVVIGPVGPQLGWHDNPLPNGHADGTSCFYMDDMASGIDVSGNLCFNSPGTWAFKWHGSKNVTVHNNVFVMQPGGNFLAYVAQGSPAPAVNNVMTGNTFQNNVVWFQSAPDWSYPFVTSTEGGPAITAWPTMSGNLYYMADGTSYHNSVTNFIDSAPIFCGPSMGGNLLGAEQAAKVWASIATGAIASWLPLATNQGPSFRNCAAGQF